MRLSTERMPHPENCLTCGFLTLRAQEYLAIDREALSPERAPASLKVPASHSGRDGGFVLSISPMAILSEPARSSPTVVGPDYQSAGCNGYRFKK